MADFSEEIARKIAERKSRHRYFPHGEPGSRGDRDHDRDRSKRRGKTDPSEMKASRDPKYKVKPKAEEPEKLEPISEFVKKERARRFERALKAMEERRAVPKDVPLKKWLSDPENLRRALRRGMVKMIAKHANPKSKDTEDVVTVAGRRYAKTDLYKTPLHERASEIALKTQHGSGMWWDKYKRPIFMGAVVIVGGYLFYNWYEKDQLEKRLVHARQRRRALAARPSPAHTGILAMPAHHWHVEDPAARAWVEHGPFLRTRFSDYSGPPYAEWDNWGDDWWSPSGWDSYGPSDPYAYWW